MRFLDNQHCVADNVFAFYQSLTQHSEPLVAQPVNVSETVSEVSEPVHIFMQHCTQENLTKK